MIIIISPEATVAKETLLVNLFFENGLDLFHVRKYEFSDDEMKKYLYEINAVFIDKVILHSHHHLADKFGINRLHFSEEARLKNMYLNYVNNTLSTSVHTIEYFNELSDIWQYAFLSPVFPSISKLDYGKHSSVLNDLKLKTNKSVQLIALSGMKPENTQQAIENGADGIALLGSIWQSNHPLNTFLQCKKIVQ